jgi:hypothetical protein
MSDMYTLVMCSEDGDVTVDCMTKKTLLERLNESYYGSLEFWSGPPGNDIQVWQGKALLIKGEIVQPFPEETVTKFEVK